MSPSWLKSLRGQHKHNRSRSESSSSSISDTVSSSIRSGFTQSQNNSKDDLDKENTNPTPYDPNHTPFKRSNKTATGPSATPEVATATALQEQCWNSPANSASSSTSVSDTDDSDTFRDSAIGSPQEDCSTDPFEDVQLSPSVLSPLPSPTVDVGSPSTTDSATSSVVSPAMSRQSSQTTASGSSREGSLDLDMCIQKLIKEGYTGNFNKRPALSNSEIVSICSMAREVLLQQPMLLEIDPSVKIVGDIHGQYHDLLRMFNMCGFPPQSNYLFLGDYVDRGAKGLECILLLLCYKIKYPQNFFILRGNHEAAAVTRVYGFFDECRRRTGQVKIWKSFIDTFNCLPVAAIVAGKIFCVHGGLSPHLLQMDQIRQLQRPAEVSEYGLLNDLLWSDPSESAVTWEPNERGVSWAFSKEVLAAFLDKHDLDLVCRAHMVVEDGYEFWADRKLLTVFSAPNYVSQFDNMGAVLSVDDQLICSFHLLKPLDGAELKRDMLRAQQKFSMEQAKNIKEKSRKKFRF